MSNTDRIAQILRCSGVLIPNDYTPTWDYNRKITELAAKIVAELQPRPGTVLADLVDRARYAIEWGNGDSLHRELLEQVEFLDQEFEVERDRANEHFDARMTAEARVRELQPRTVETVEQLDALPVRSVVRDADGDIHEQDDCGYWRCPRYPSVLNTVVLPARVLYTPEADR